MAAVLAGGDPGGDDALAPVAVVKAEGDARALGDAALWDAVPRDRGAAKGPDDGVLLLAERAFDVSSRERIDVRESQERLRRAQPESQPQGDRRAEVLAARSVGEAQATRSSREKTARPGETGLAAPSASAIASGEACSTPTEPARLFERPPRPRSVASAAGTKAWRVPSTSESARSTARRIERPVKSGSARTTTRAPAARVAAARSARASALVGPRELPFRTKVDAPGSARATTAASCEPSTTTKSRGRR